jgi:aspartate aminotransferase
MRLSRRAESARPSATLSLDATAKAMLARGEDVVMFTVGEPDFDTPDNIKQAAIRAIQAGYTKYTPAAGSLELRRAIAAKLKKDNGLSYDPDQVLVSNGAKQALYIIMLCLLDEGDEVLLPGPYWVSYPDQAEVCGARAVVIDGTAAPDLKVTPAMLEGAVTKRSKLLILNSPCNPSGVVYTGEELRALAEVAVRHNLWIMSDEVYEKLVYDGLTHVSTAALSRQAYERTITVNGVSKTYAMTGWRIGYAAGPREVIRAAVDIQSNLTSGPNSIAQKASLAALTEEQDSVEEMRAVFARRRDLIVEGLNSIEGVRCVVPRGAFYALPDCRGLLRHTYAGRKVSDSVSLSEALLQAVKVAVVPGAPFGAEGHLRFSYAVSESDIQKGIERLGRFVQMRED